MDCQIIVTVPNKNYTIIIFDEIWMDIICLIWERLLYLQLKAWNSVVNMSLFEVYSCTMGLCHLQVSWYVIQPAILAEMRSSLLEVERDI